MMRPGALVMASALALMLAGVAARSAPETASQKASTAASEHAAATGSASTPAPARQNTAASENTGVQKAGEYAIGKDNQVGPGLLHGWLFFGEYCARCHGPTGGGSTFAPSLLDAVKTLSKFEFESTVINGLQNKTTEQVMPAFGTVSDVVLHLNDIHQYLLDRADGKLGGGMLSLIGND